MGMGNAGSSSSGYSFISTIIARMPYTYKVLQNAFEKNPKYEVFNDLIPHPEQRIKQQSIFQNQVGPAGGELLIDRRYHDVVYADIDIDKIRRVQEYRKMAGYSELAECIDEIADEAIVKDSNGDVVKCFVMGDHDKTIVEGVQKEWKRFINVFDLEQRGWEFIRRFLIEGEIFFENVISQTRPDYGIIGVVTMPTELVNPIYDNVQNQVINGYLLRKPVLDPRRSILNQQAEEMIVMDKNQVTYLHSGMWNEDHTIRVPYIENARRAYKQLSLIEDSIVIHRLVRAPERLVFKVDVGNMPVPKAEEYMRKLMQQFWARKNFDSSQGKVGNVYAPQSMLDAYWVSKRGNSTGTEISTLPGGCLAMDTEIPLLDGRTLTLREMMQEYQSGKENWIYSCDPATGKFAPGIVSWAGVTQKSAKVMKLTFDNGKSIICTLDHKFPVIGRGEVEAKDLTIGESLIPLNKRSRYIKNKIENNYEQIYQNDTKKWEFTHRLVARSLNDSIQSLNYEDLGEKKNTIHHANYNKWDNSPSNLRLSGFREHFHYHQKCTTLAGDAIHKKFETMRNEDPEAYKVWCENMGKRTKTMWQDRTKQEYDEVCEKQLKGILNYWDNVTPEEKAKRVELARKNWLKGNQRSVYLIQNDPKQLERYRKTWENIKQSRKSDPEWLAKFDERSEKCRRVHANDPTIGARAGLKETIKFEKSMLDFVQTLVKGKTTHQFTGEDVTKAVYQNTKLYNRFLELNKDTHCANWDHKTINHRQLDLMVKQFGYNSWKHFRKESNCYNHKIVSIEYLSDPIEVGTLTIDQNETYHGYHTFATCCGVYTFNSNFGALDDLNYFIKKLWRSLKVPQQRLDPTNAFSDGEQITREELRFARFIMRIQQQIAIGLKRAFITHMQLRDKNKNDKDAKSLWEKFALRDHQIRIEFNMPTSFAVMREQQIFNLKKENFTGLAATELMSQSFCQKYYLGLEDKQMAENREWLRKDASLSWELQQIINNGPDFRNKLLAEPGEGEGGEMGGLGGIGGGGGGSSLPSVPGTETPPPFGPGPENAGGGAPGGAPGTAPATNAPPTNAPAPAGK